MDKRLRSCLSPIATQIAALSISQTTFDARLTQLEQAPPPVVPLISTASSLPSSAEELAQQRCLSNIIVKYRNKVAKDYVITDLAALAPYVTSDFHPPNVYFLGREAYTTKVSNRYKLTFDSPKQKDIFLSALRSTPQRPEGRFDFDLTWAQRSTRASSYQMCTQYMRDHHLDTARVFFIYMTPFV